jgi:tetratricopeptide (TPR) repeat protein
MCALLLAGCASSPLQRQLCYDPDAQLAAVLTPLETLRAANCNAATDRNGPLECARLRLELERLAVICPVHAPTLMANAVFAYDERQPAKAQQFLDRLLSLSRTYPDAVVLRAQIAIEEGNLPFARRLLEQQIKLVPDHAGLYETYGAALYLEGELAGARQVLAQAGTLGAPRWRIAYHLGLVEEAAGRLDESRRYYAEALEGNPGWAPAQSRLKALLAREERRP